MDVIIGFINYYFNKRYNYLSYNALTKNACECYINL